MHENKDLRNSIIFNPAFYVQPYEADTARLHIFCHKMIEIVKNVVNSMALERKTGLAKVFIKDIIKNIKKRDYFSIDDIAIYYFDQEDKDFSNPHETKLGTDIINFIANNIESIRCVYPTGDRKLDDQIMQNAIRELEYGDFGYGNENSNLILHIPNKYSIIDITVDLEKLSSLGIIKISNWKFDFIATEKELEEYLIKNNLWFELTYTNSPILSNLKEMIQFIKSSDNEAAKESFKKLNESILEYYDSHDIRVEQNSVYGTFYSLPQHEEMYKTLVGMIKSMYPELIFSSYLNIKTGEFIFVPYSYLYWW